MDVLRSCMKYAGTAPLPTEEVGICPMVRQSVQYTRTVLGKRLYALVNKNIAKLNTEFKSLRDGLSLWGSGNQDVQFYKPKPARCYLAQIGIFE